jgi:hypothetical protein
VAKKTNVNISSPVKIPSRWVRGSPDDSTYTIYHLIMVPAISFKGVNDEKRLYSEK